jgi:hypothetical protein
MKINTLKELVEVIKVCKKHGIRDITIDGIHMLVDNYEPKQNLKTEQTKPSSNIETPDQLTDEDILFYSSTPLS